MIRVVRTFLLGLALVGCASTPRTQAKRTELHEKADQAREAMLNKDPSVRSLLDQSAGYIIFPEVK